MEGDKSELQGKAATKIQAVYKGYSTRKDYRKQKEPEGSQPNISPPESNIDEVSKVRNVEHSKPEKEEKTNDSITQTPPPSKRFQYSSVTNEGYKDYINSVLGSVLTEGLTSLSKQKPHEPVVRDFSN